MKLNLTILDRSNPDIRSKGELCGQLTESVHRARSALNEEREKSERLDRKLEAEGRAAKKARLICSTFCNLLLKLSL